jgi:hypothetical protein
MAQNKRTKAGQDGFTASNDHNEDGYNNERYRDSRHVEGMDHDDIGNSSNTGRPDDRILSPPRFDAFEAHQYPENNSSKSNFVQPHQKFTPSDNTKTFDGETWAYTITSHGKQLNTFDDAKRYIHGLARIWKIDEESLEAQRFITTVENAVTDRKKDYSPEFIYEGRTNVVFVTVKVQSQKGEKCTIYHCLQLLQRRSPKDGISSSQTFNQRPPISFFRKNAEKSIATHGAVVGSVAPPINYPKGYDLDGKEDNATNSFPGSLCNTQ